MFDAVDKLSSDLSSATPKINDVICLQVVFADQINEGGADSELKLIVFMTSIRCPIKFLFN